MRFAKFWRRLSVLAVYSFVSTSLLIFHGPFGALRTYVIDDFCTSMHGYLLRPLSLYTLPMSVIRAHTPSLVNTAATFTSSEIALHDYTTVNDGNITVTTYVQPTFTAKVMFVRDPKRLKVAVTRFRGSVGQTVSQMVEENHAVAGINGGGFRDTHWQGTGGLPLGITIEDGQVVVADTSLQPVIALTNKGALIAGSYDLTQLRALHVSQALSFGPVLIQNGSDMVSGDGGWGDAPRMAIGQLPNGTIVLAVTDGRFVHGPNNLGASLQDMSQLMIHYGAVVAANLDGGSSTTMVYQGKLLNTPTDILGERAVATSILVMPEQGGAL